MIIKEKRMDKLTHFNSAGRARMVDVTEKKETKRIAIAKGKVILKKETFERIKEGGIKKGDVLGTAQIAGVMAAKKTFELIPMCHPIFIEAVDINFELSENDEKKEYVIEIEASVKCTGPTGVEMEALTAVSVSALTIYDMCKAIQKDIIIGEIYLEKKCGGKSGEYNINRG